MSKNTKSALKINKIKPTNEKITVRSGMSLFVRYDDKTGICDILAEIFRDLRKSKEGVGVSSLCKQLLCYFMEGGSLRLTQARIYDCTRYVLSKKIRTLVMGGRGEESRNNGR